MHDIETWEISGNTVEFLNDCHVYLVGGVIVPSITQILKGKFGAKYNGVSKATLNHASELGTQMHQAIQDFEEKGTESDLKELRNYKFLKSRYGWEHLESEVPVILFRADEPIACGRIDMVGEINGQIGLFDFKRTSALDKNYLAGQLNLYRIAYQQSYGQQIDFLRGIHLREDTRKVVEIPINESRAWELVDQYFGGNDGNIQSD